MSRRPHGTAGRLGMMASASCLAILAEASGENNEIDLVPVPAGEFTMGLVDTQRDRLVDVGWPPEEFLDELPAHQVTLEAYYITKYKVSNSQFAAFLNSLDEPSAPGPAAYHFEGGIASPAIRLEEASGRYMVEAERADEPVNQATWTGAVAYCSSLGMRLPTEAEWEKAARGDDGRTYPWGEAIDRNRANYGTEMTLNLILLRRDSPDESIDVHESDWLDASDGHLRVSPIDAYPTGASPYGVLDMVGNVYEWTADRYASDRYSKSEVTGPVGPDSGEYRAIRGCAYDCGRDELRVTNRSWDTPDRAVRSGLIGFRCASGEDPRATVPDHSWGEVKSSVRQSNGGPAPRQ